MTTTNTLYEINLRPAEDYFFGGERTFGARGTQQRNYFGVSNYYPQQTTLLGLLRFWLLQAHGLLPLHQHRQEANEVIGPASFKPDQEKAQAFGAIKALYPLLLKKGQQYYRIGHQLESLHTTFSTQGAQASTGQGLLAAVPQLQGFDPKKNYELCAIPLSQQEPPAPAALPDPVPITALTESAEQIGIEKAGEDEAFFKHLFYRLKGGWQFCFFAALAPKTTLPPHAILPFGAEQKQFAATATPTQHSPWLQAASPGGQPKATANGPWRITLLSDALLQQEQLQQAAFALAQTTPYRTIVQGYKGRSFEKSPVKYTLLQRGSQLFATSLEQVQALENALKSHPNFYQIGFNHYFKTSISTHGAQ